jgi:hypothetical protein
MPLDVTIVIEYGIMFATVIFFTAIAIDRETMLANLLASVAWFSVAIANFYLDPTGTLSFALAWIFGAVGSIFMGVMFYNMYSAHLEKKEERFKPL